MYECSKLSEAVNIERNIERWTVLENIQSAVFKIEKSQNRSSLVVIFFLHFTRQINPKLSPSRLFSACRKISQIRVFLLW